jgi:hypothetical protein
MMKATNQMSTRDQMNALVAPQQVGMGQLKDSMQTPVVHNQNAFRSVF